MGGGSNTTQSQELPALITKAVLAEALSVSVRTIDGWVAGQRITAYRLGRRCIRFNLQEVLEELGRFRVAADAGYSSKPITNRLSARFVSKVGGAK
jgi:excisionase family DNA binding protein